MRFRDDCENAEVERVAEKSIGIIRFERHSYINNLQVILTLLQMNKIDRAQEYIKEISSTLQKESLCLRQLPPALALWLAEKNCESQEKNLSLSVEACAVNESAQFDLAEISTLEEEWMRASNLTSKSEEPHSIKVKITCEGASLKVTILS